MVRKILETAGIESAAFEARQIEAAHLGEAAALRRAGGEPLQYILGEWDFYGRTFLCKKDALIPRPETELLVSAALDFAEDGLTVADLGCGTGCIGLTIAAEKNCAVSLFDISEPALSLAGENAKKLGITNAKIEYGSIFNGPKADFDVIVSNPPYIKTADIKTLQKEVLFEPVTALDGGTDGLHFYRAIARLWAPVCRTALLLEVGAGQAMDVAKMLEKYGEVTVKQDYSKIERIVILKK